MSNRLPAAERRKQLLDVAMTVFADNGYHGASMNDVASTAGVTKPVLYQHFHSKQDLYSELIDDVGSRLSSIVVAAAKSANDPFTQTGAALAAYFNFVEKNQREFKLLFGRGAAREEDRVNGPQLVEKRMAEVAEALLDELNQNVSARQTATVAQAIVAMAEGVCRHWIAQQDDRIPADELAFEIGSLIIHGLSGLAR
ncbi:MAG: TetR family transcriptional regulator [Actinobacteria bacterium]|nr:TetR family transcriptional regulator [Actinomycetota bacterium]